MAVEIVVPEMGESVVEATVGHWLKQEGERVQASETLVELETDKVNLEVSAPNAGVLHIERKEGEDVKVGDVIGRIEEVPEQAPVSAAKTPPPPSVAREPTAAVPHDGDRGTPVAKKLAEESGIDISQVPGTGTGGRVTRQDVEAFIEKQKGPETTGQTPSAAPAAPREAAPQAQPIQPKPAAAPAPSIAPIAPSEAPPQVQPAQPKPAAPPQPTPAAERADREERVRMSRRRRTIAQRLLEAKQTTAMLTTFNEMDMSAVMAIRQRQREAFKDKYGVGLGFTSFFVKASIGALRAFPQLNAEIQGDEIVFKHYYDIGVAVGAAEGVVVPVLHEADRMAFAEIEKAIKEYAQKAEDGTLSIEDLRGGTFTITNGGVFGSLLSTPILNLPQVGILGLHKVEERPIAMNGQVVIHPMMYVALSYDHRIVDGREAVQFLATIKRLIEDPDALLLEG